MHESKSKGPTLHRRHGRRGNEYNDRTARGYGRGDPRGGPQPASDRGSPPYVGGKLRLDHHGLQFDRLGRPGGQRHFADLRDGDRDRDPARGRRARLQQRDRPGGAPERPHLKIPLPASILTLAGVLLFCIFLLPSASAQEDLSVRKVVFNVTEVDFQDSEPHYGVQGTLTWLASHPNTTADWGYIVNPFFISLSFVDIETIPGRTNWLTFNNSVDEPGSVFITLEEANDTQRLAVGIGTGSSPSYSSCVIVLRAQVGSYSCGEPAFPPVDSLTVENEAEFPPLMSFQLRHPQTSSDVLLDGVIYEYQAFFGAIWADLSYNSTTTDASGIVRTWFNTTDWAPDLVTFNTFRVRALDQRTHEISEWSCTVQSRIGRTDLGPYSCVGQSPFVLRGGEGDAAFPLADVPALSSGLGLTLEQTALFMGLLFGFLVIILVAFVGGLVPAILAAICLIPFLYTLNSIAAYVLTFVFMIVTTIVVLSWRLGNKEA